MADRYLDLPPGVRAHFSQICDPAAHTHPRSLEAMIHCALSTLAEEDGAAGSA